MVISNLLLYFGCSFEIYSFISPKIKKKKYKNAFWIIPGIFLILFAFVSNNIHFRVLVSSTYYLIIFCVLFLLFALGKKTSYTQKFVGWLALVMVIVHFIRGINSFSHEINVYSEISAHTLLGIVWVVNNYMIPVLFLLIILEKDNSKLINSINTKNRFFKIISHDLKSPISNIIQVSHMLDDNMDALSDQEQQQMVHLLKKSSNKTFNLLENLLQWAQSQTNEIQYQPEYMSLPFSINENIDLYKNSEQSKGITIELKNEKSMHVWADINLFNTIMRNLISNAIKFSHKNSKIEINYFKENETIIFKIRDFGIGISNERKNKLFKEKYIESTMGTHNESGTGLGLLLCKEFVEMNNGCISINNELETGTEIIFELPIKEV